MRDAARGERFRARVPRAAAARDERLVVRTAARQSCERERFAARRQKISRRVRAPAFAGATTGLRGARNALGTPPGALQRPHATCYHLRPLALPLTPPSDKVLPYTSIKFATADKRKRHTASYDETKRRAPRNDSPDTPGPKIAEMTYDEIEDVD